MLQSIEKRNGELVFFDHIKIEEAVFKALQFTKPEVTKAHLRRLSECVSEDVRTQLELKGKQKIVEDWIPSVEDIQDEVERVLMRIGEYETARNYIKYRLERKEKREKAQSLEGILDLFRSASGHQWDFSNPNNAVVTRIGQLSSAVFSHAAETFWLNEVYDEAVKTAHLNREICIHDLGKLAFRSVSLNIEPILIKGSTQSSGGPKHFDSALMQLITTLTHLSDEVAGPITIYHFDTLLAPFIQNDELTFQQVKHCLQNFIIRFYEMTEHFTEPFSLTLAMDKDLTNEFEHKAVSIPLALVQLNSYHHFQMEMDMINQCFCELFAEDIFRKDSNLIQIQYQVHDNWNWDSVTTDRILGAVLKTDFIVFSRSTSAQAHQNEYGGVTADQRIKKAVESNQLLRRNGGPLGSGEGSGICGLVTLNIGQIGRKSDTLEQFFEYLEAGIAVAVEALRQKRQFLMTAVERGLYPEIGTRHQINQFYDAVGIWGLNEGVHAFTKGEDSLSTHGGQGFAEEILDFVNDYLVLAQCQDHVLYSLDQIQASCAETFEAKSYGADPNMFYAEDCFEQLDCQDRLLHKFTGGSLFRAKLTGKSVNLFQLKHNIQRILNHYKAFYFSFYSN